MASSSTFRISFMLILFFISFNNLTAQTYSFSPQATMDEQAVYNEYTVFQINISNETTDTLQLTWRLVQQSIPEGWEVTLCDNNACYGGIPVSSPFYPIFDDNFGFIKLTINPFEIPGTLDFLFHIYHTDDPQNYEEMHFIITAGEPLASQTPQDHILNIYPNPATDRAHIQNTSTENLTIRMVNANGQIIETFQLQGADQQLLEFNQSEKGMIFLQLFSDDRFLGIQKITKQ